MKRTLFEEIADCIRHGGDAVSGSVFVRRKDLAEFLEDIPASAPVPVMEPVNPVNKVEKPAAKVVEWTEEPPVFKAVPRTDVSGMDLAGLRLSAENCRACPLSCSRNRTVFGTGPEHARVMFIDKAPGPEADASGDPFAGAAGELLLKMIRAMHLSRENVYFTYTVKCRPPEDRSPEDIESSACFPLLAHEIRAVKPEVLVLLGSAALKAVMEKGKISQVRGKWMEYEGIPVMPTFNPGYLLRAPKAKREVWNDLQLVMQKIGL